MKATKFPARPFVGGLLAVASFAFLSAHAQSTPPKASPATTHPRLAEEQFKNIQALKGIPADQLIPSMQFISASLGVECEFCHVHGSMEKDDKKPKVAARKMITMVLGLNKNFFNGTTEVSCYLCHRGRTSPVGVPQLPLPEPSPRPEGGQGPQREALPTADQLLEKYTQALGGSAAIEKLKHHPEPDANFMSVRQLGEWPVISAGDRVWL